jgi:hypothetical protein
MQRTAPSNRRTAGSRQLWRLPGHGRRVRWTAPMGACGGSRLENHCVQVRHAAVGLRLDRSPRQLVLDVHEVGERPLQAAHDRRRGTPRRCSPARRLREPDGRRRRAYHRVDKTSRSESIYESRMPPALQTRDLGCLRALMSGRNSLVCLQPRRLLHSVQPSNTAWASPWRLKVPVWRAPWCSCTRRWGIADDEHLAGFLHYCLLVVVSGYAL